MNISFSDISVFGKSVFFAFFFLNILIVISDIRSRIIPNIFLIFLFALIPFWYSAFAYSSIDIIYQLSIISFLVLSIGILFFDKKTTLGSGDIKYGALLILFLGSTPFSLFIGNMGILTLLLLLFWWSMIVGDLSYIFTKHRGVFKEQYFALKTNFFQNSSLYDRKDFFKKIAIFIFDWVIIGFFLSQLIPQIFLIFSSFNSSIFAGRTGDMYFLLSISLFFLRPYIRSLIQVPKNTFIVLSITAYIFLAFFFHYGVSVTFDMILIYLANMWKFIVLILIIGSITSGTFRFHTDMYRGKYSEFTFPYSLLIFLAFFFAVIYPFDIFGFFTFWR